MSGPGLGPKTRPQPANEPGERSRGEEQRRKVKISYVEEENQGRPLPPMKPAHSCLCRGGVEKEGE